MNRQEILEFINNVIEEERGVRVKEDQLLTDCGIDSFGYAILWTSVEGEFVAKPFSARFSFCDFGLKDYFSRLISSLKFSVK